MTMPTPTPGDSPAAVLDALAAEQSKAGRSRTLDRWSGQIVPRCRSVLDDPDASAESTRAARAVLEGMDAVAEAVGRIAGAQSAGRRR